MTREEAIQVLTDIKRIRSDEIAKAIDMAIEALSNNITESSNDVTESQNDVIKKPRTVRYKLHKPIEYVSIEVDEEETVTDIAHYNEVVQCKDCRHGWYDDDIDYYVCRHPKGLNEELYGVDYCSYGQAKEQTEYKLPGYDKIMEKLDELTLKGGDHE